jgi:hypothetical protein
MERFYNVERETRNVVCSCHPEAAASSRLKDLAARSVKKAALAADGSDNSDDPSVAMRQLPQDDRGPRIVTSTT